MKGQLQSIEMYMLIVGISLLIGIMFSMYSTSVSQLSGFSKKRMLERSLSSYCKSFPMGSIKNTTKTLGELMVIYNSTGNDAFVLDGKYFVNLTSRINSTLSMRFGRRWSFEFGAMKLGYDAPAGHAGCRIYAPSIKKKSAIYAVLKVW